jgi:hypothetical protein
LLALRARERILVAGVIRSTPLTTWPVLRSQAARHPRTNPLRPVATPVTFCSAGALCGSLMGDRSAAPPRHLFGSSPPAAGLPDEVVLMPSNEPTSTETRHPARPTLRGALLWAVVGAALFAGVGEELPVWPINTECRAELWCAFYHQWLFAGGAWLGNNGLIGSPGVRDLAAGLLGLLLLGALAGLLGYRAWLALRWKGGGA